MKVKLWHLPHDLAYKFNFNFKPPSSLARTSQTNKVKNIKNEATAVPSFFAFIKNEHIQNICKIYFLKEC